MKTRILFFLGAFLLILSVNAQFTNNVTNTNDSGPGSFRQAILNANSNGQGIVFTIPPVPFQNIFTIILNSRLPDLNLTAFTTGLKFENQYFNPMTGFNNAKIVVQGNFSIPGPGLTFVGQKPTNQIKQGTFINFAPITFTVTNTNDDFQGSLRDAIFHANLCTSRDSIKFNIPGIAPHKINISRLLPDIVSPIVLDGSSQPANGFVGPDPKIELDGSNLTLPAWSMNERPASGTLSNSPTGLMVCGIDLSGGSNPYQGNNVDIFGLYIHNFFNGIVLIGNQYKIGAIGKGNVISGNSIDGISLGVSSNYPGVAYMGLKSDNVIIQDNKIGTRPNGVDPEPNTYGINVGGTNIKIYDNLLSGNKFTVLNNYLNYGLHGRNFSNLEMLRNKIGTDITGTKAVPNLQFVMHFKEYGTNVFIGSNSINDRNIFSGNKNGSIELDGTKNAIVQNNYIGIDINGINKIPNDGFFIHGGNGTIIKNNIISGNLADSIYNKVILFTEVGTIISKNSIYNNNRSIKENKNLPAPIITLQSADSIVGTSNANVTIELYEDNGFNSFTQGKTFIGEVVADALGNWKFVGPIANPCMVTAIAIDYTNKNTSSFSIGPNYSIGSDKIQCVNDTIVLDGKKGYSSYLWSTGETTQTIKVNQQNNYWVEVNNGCIHRDTIHIDFINRPVVSLGKDTTLCSGQSIVLDAGNPGATYNWNLGGVSQTRTVSATSTLIAQVAFGNCKSADTIVITVIPKPIVNLGPDQVICNGSPINVILSDLNTGVTRLWSDGKTANKDTLSSVGTYWLRASNACFVVTDTMKISYSTISVNIGNDTTVCANLILDAKNTGATYKWNNNFSNTSQTFTASSSGIYFVDVTIGSCTKRDSIVVTKNTFPSVNLGNDTLVCSGQNFTLDAKNPTCTYAWSTGESTKTIGVTTSGNYSVAVSYQGACVRKDSINIVFTDCEKIYGTVFNEQNSDCIKNNNEIGISGKLVVLKNITSGKTYYTTSDNQGNYEVSLPYGNYQVSLTPKNYQTIKCPLTNLYSFSLTGNNIVPTCNFGITLLPYTDFSVALGSNNTIRLNSFVRYTINYKNNGSTSSDGLVRFIKDPFMNFGSQSITCRISGDTLEYDFASMLQDQSNTISILLYEPGNSTLIGKSLCNVVQVVPIATDNYLYNNSSSFCQRLGYPYDPNNKEVAVSNSANQTNIGAKDSILTYTINFQNTGSDTAHVVVVKDTLSSLLIVESLEIIGSSHLCNLAISGEGIAHFTFPTIMLPDSNVNEKESHGFVKFTIRRKPGTMDGSKIDNKAFIYFDMAAPVETNTASLIYNQNLSNQSINFSAISDKYYDSGTIPIQAFASSGLATDYAFSGPVSLTGNNLTILGTGEVRIRAYQDGNNLFGPANFVDHVFTILKANQFLQFDSIPDVLETSTVQLTATGGNSGSPILFSVVSGPATINNGIVSFTGTGEVIISASQQGNQNYNDANQVTRSFNVTNATEVKGKSLLEISLKIYPNPSSGIFGVELSKSLKLDAGYKLQLYNSTGVLVDSRKAEYINEYKLTLEKGIYFLTISNLDQSVSHKIIVE